MQYIQKQPMETFRKMEQFAFKCIGRINGKMWRGGEQEQDRTTLYTKYKQPDIQSWIQKLATTHVLQQTSQNGEYIRKINTSQITYLTHGK